MRHKLWLRNSFMMWSCMIVVFTAAPSQRDLVALVFTSVELRCYKIDALTFSIYCNLILPAVSMD